MGLSETRKRTKISHDPNNTKWTRSDTSYGHKILIAQGWTPGSYLGSQNAPQASSFTAANASHIRVVLKDDNLGLGAQKYGPVEKQRTGLDAFQGLLGRLNGKTDTELEKEKKKLEEQQSARCLQTRWNLLHFVKGGLLVQEKIMLPSPASTKSLQGTDDEDQETRVIVVEDEFGEDSPFREARSDSEAKKRKRRRNSREKKLSPIVESSVPKSMANGQTASLLNSPSPNTSEKLNGKDYKEKRHCITEDDGCGEDERAQVKLFAAMKKRVSVSPSSLLNPTSISQPRHVEGRHAIRNRHIMQKKMAMMDSKALDEIFARM